MESGMTPEQALEFLCGCTTLARLVKEDHVKCQAAESVIKEALQNAGQGSDAEDQE